MAKKSRIQWQGRSWRLRVISFDSPDRTLVERGIIEHPGSVVLVPLQGKNILMLRQYRLALDETIWELPAGTRDGDEDWLICAQRELREETGFRAKYFTPLGKVWPAPGMTDELMAVYLATGLTESPLPADVDEQIEVVPRPLKELVRMAIDGRLKDAKSVVAILRADAYLSKKNIPKQ